MALKKYISIQHIYGTEAELTTDNRILLKGQVAFSDDGTDIRQKVGDGVTAYNSLPYVGGGGSSIPASRTLTINGDDKDLSDDREWRVAQADTGCLTSVGLTANSSTTINIGAVEGYVVDNETDPSNPTYTKITYAGETSKTVTTVGSGLSSYVMLGVGGVISFQNTFPTSAERKAKIWLGKVGHPTGVITTVINEPDFITSPQALSRDLFQALGPYINNNVYPYANGANLSVNITAGSIRGNGINFVGSVANRQDPDKLAVGPFTPLSFLYRTRTGAGGTAVTLITPDVYDLAGAITPIGGGVNRSTIQYIFCIPGVGFVIQYGQNIYNTLTDAISFIGRESFTVFSNLPDNAILIGVLAVKRSATNLSDETQAHFFNADKLGQIIGATSGVSVGTMQTGYNNSLAPQITTSTALGAVQYKRGSTADTDNVFQVLNGAGTATFSVTGEGLTTEKGFVTNGSFSAVANLAKANQINNTLVATANNDVLAGLDINPTFNVGAFTGGTQNALRIPPRGTGHILVGSTNNAGLIQFARGNDGSAVAAVGYNTAASTGDFGMISTGGSAIVFLSGQTGVEFRLNSSFLIGKGYSTGNWVFQNGGTFTDDTVNRLQVNGSGIFKGGSEAVKVSTATGNPDHAYIGLYARTASPTTQSGYIGYNGVGSSTLSVVNSISGGNMALTTTNGKVQVKTASGTDTNATLEVLNTAGTATFSVAGNGGFTGTTGILNFIQTRNNTNAGTFYQMATTGGTTRWGWQGTGVESGSSAGYNLALHAYNDAGVQTAQPHLQVIRSNGNVLLANSGSDDGVNRLQVAGSIISQFGTKASDPVAADIPAGYSKLYKNTTSGLLKLWANDGGTLKSVTLS